MARIEIGNIVFDDSATPLPRNPGALDIEWWYEPRLVEYKIAGYKDMTQVTSNVTLLHCNITIRTTDAGGIGGDGHQKFLDLMELIAKPGPFVVQNNVWPPRLMYFKGNPKFRQTAGENNWVGTWTLPFVEKYDG